MLRTAKNVYLTGGVPTIDAAAELLMYTSGGIEHGRRLYVDGTYRNKARATITAALKRLTAEEIHAAVKEYVHECLRVPGHKTTSSDSDGARVTVAAPSEWAIAETLCRGDASKLDAAFDTPFSVAHCLFDAGRSVRGDDDSLIDEAAEERTDAKLEKMAAVRGGE